MERIQVMQVRQEDQEVAVEAMALVQQVQVTVLQYHHHKEMVVEMVLLIILN